MPPLSLSDIRTVHREFRATDESHLWPINGRFNATKRAIRRLRCLRAQGLEIADAESYRCLLEQLISLVVNSPHVADYENRINWQELNA